MTKLIRTIRVSQETYDLIVKFKLVESETLDSAINRRFKVKK